ncbi:MAG TPA: hypothetical protein VFV08_00765, partial [Puia sp.]|nr:hypothetical protein [Puia sp.]
KQSGQALLGNKIPNSRTVDEPSSTEENNEFNTSFAFGISSILKGSNVKSVIVEAHNVQVTNINNSVDSLPTGSRIVMSGLKADSATITITKKSGFKLSLNQLLDKIKNFAAVSGASTLNVLTLIDSINYDRNQIVKIIVKNPNVIYAIIVGQITQEYAGSAYLDLKNQLNPSTLRLNSTTDRILPKYSDDFEQIGYPRAFMISATLDASNQPHLFVLATKQSGGVDSVEVSKIGNNWSSNNILFTSIVPGKVTKRYYVDINAHLSDDGKSIIIDNGAIRYPEWVLDAISRKDL